MWIPLWTNCESIFLILLSKFVLKSVLKSVAKWFRCEIFCDFPRGIFRGMFCKLSYEHAAKSSVDSFIKIVSLNLICECFIKSSVETMVKRFVKYLTKLLVRVYAKSLVKVCKHFWILLMCCNVFLWMQVRIDLWPPPPCEICGGIIREIYFL